VSWNNLDRVQRELGSSNRTLILLGRVPGIRRKIFMERFSEYVTRRNILATVLESSRPTAVAAKEAIQDAQEYGLLVIMGFGWWDKLLEVGGVRDWTDGLVDFKATVGGKRMKVLKFPKVAIHPIAGMEMHLNWVRSETGLLTQ